MSIIIAHYEALWYTFGFIWLKLLEASLRFTHLPNEDLCIQNEQAKRGFNLCLWMYDNAEKLIFEILPHSIFYYSQYRQYIWADLVVLALLFGLPSKILCGRISKMSFLHYPNIHKHGLMPLLACSFCICKAPFSRRVMEKLPTYYSAVLYYALHFFVEERGMRNLMTRNSSRGKQARKTRNWPV